MIKIPQTRNIAIDNIKEDLKNPNEMTEEAYQSLKKVIAKYGFLVPIITNKDLKIADGFHRWKAAKELGMTEIPTIVLNVSEVDRVMLRQIMNKLKGEHQQYRDIEDFRLIVSEDQEMLKDYLAMGDDELKRINDMLNETNDLDLETDRGNIEKMYQTRALFLTNKEALIFDKYLAGEERKGKKVVELIINETRKKRSADKKN